MIDETNRAVGVLDYGTSGTKCIAKYCEAATPFEEVEKFWLLNPSVQKLTEQSYLQLVKDSQDYGHTPHSAAIAYKDPETRVQQFFQVGVDAQSSGPLLIKKRKFISCLAKTLTFLGYLALEGFGQDPIHLDLGILLPYNEYDDKDLLVTWLEEVTQSFEYDGILVENIELNSVSVMPEGYGIYKEYTAEKVLICGHRDITLMSFGKGRMIARETKTFPESGFHDFLGLIRFPLGDELNASEVIYNAGRKLTKGRLLSLTQTKGNAEVERLINAIAIARHQYWIKRVEQLSSVSYKGDKAIAISGGTGNYFSHELTGFYRDRKIRCHWCKDLMLEFFERFNLAEKSSLLLRFADCYGFYKTMPGVEPFMNAEVEVMSNV